MDNERDPRARVAQGESCERERSTTVGITVNGQPAEIGCYVDGMWGQYMPDRMVDVVRGFGIEVPTNEDPRHWRTLATFAEGNGQHDIASGHWDRYREAADDLVSILNDKTDGGLWAFQDGELFLFSYVCPDCCRDARDAFGPDDPLSPACPACIDAGWL